MQLSLRSTIKHVPCLRAVAVGAMVSLAASALGAGTSSSAEASSQSQPAGRYATAVLASAPIAYWPLDDVVSGTEVAEVISGRNGIAEGIDGTSPAKGAVDGRPGGIFYGDQTAPDGKYTGVNLDAHASELQPAGDFSLEAWVKPAQDEGVIEDFSGRFFRWRGYGWNFDIYQGHASFGGWPGGNPIGVDSVTRVQPNAWHYLVAARHGGELSVYVDGREAETTANGSAEPPIYGGNELSIGRDGAYTRGSIPNFRGQLDEVALYDRALSIADIRSHYTAARARAIPIGGGSSIISRNWSDADALAGGEACTSGFGVKTKGGGKRMVLTAAHCTTITNPEDPDYPYSFPRSTFYDADPGRGALISLTVKNCREDSGNCRTTTWPYDDTPLWPRNYLDALAFGPAAGIKVDNVVRSKDPAYPNFQIVGSVKNKGYGDMEDDWVCMYGAASGHQCGQITERNSDGTRFSSICAVGGDSGSPVVAKDTSLAEGIVIESQGCRTKFIQIRHLMDKLGLNLLTR